MTESMAMSWTTRTTKKLGSW